MKQKIYINNAEYSAIFNYEGLDTDKLCSVFVHIRAGKEGKRRYSPGVKLKHYGLLSNQTSLSRHAIETYVPALIKLNLIRLNKDGGVSINSTTASFKTHGEKLAREILIPIKIQNSYLKTALNIAYVRIRSNIKNQQKQIDSKDRQQKLLKKYIYQSRHPEKIILTLKETKAAEKLLKRVGSLDEFKKDYCTETILSLEGFSRIKKNGKYFKKQLVDNNLIINKHRFKTVVNFYVRVADYYSNINTFRALYGNGIYRDRVTGFVNVILSSGIEIVNK